MPPGYLLWQRELPALGPDGNVIPGGLAVDADGAVTVAGYRSGGWTQGGILWRYDADGQLLLELPGSSLFTVALAESNGSTLLGGYDGLTRVDAQGQAVWSYATGLPYEIDRYGDGPIISSGGGLLRAIDDAGMGTELWSASRPDGWYAHVAVAPDDTIVANWGSDSWPPVSYIDRYDLDGNLLTSEQFVSGDIASLAVLASGEIVVAWHDENWANAYIALLSADASTMLWAVAQDSPWGSYISDLAVSDLGEIAYVGTEGEFDGNFEYVKKIDSNGTELWTADLDQGGNENPHRVAFGPDGSVYTATIKYPGNAWLHKFSR